MKITDVCIDAYREECERAETESLDIKEQEVAEIALPKELLSELERIKDIDVLVNHTSYKDNRLFSCATLIYKGERAVAALGFAMISKGTDEKHISALIGKCKHEAERRLKFT